MILRGRKNCATRSIKRRFAALPDRASRPQLSGDDEAANEGAPVRTLLHPEHDAHAYHRQPDQKRYDGSGAHSFVVLYDPQTRQWIVTL